MAISDAAANAFFLVINAALVFLMQAGFGFLECGAVRSKNATNVVLKNIMIAFAGVITFWLVGFGLASGAGGVFIGTKNFALDEVSGVGYAQFFFQLSLALTAATIVSGAVAERCEFVAYLVYSVVITGWIFPLVFHWSNHTSGWLRTGLAYNLSDDTPRVAIFHDTAGSGVVHLLGGTCALVATAILGPRIGRFDSSGRDRTIKGHSVPLEALGAILIFFGFFGFNGGSIGGITTDVHAAAYGLAVTNTIIAGAFGGMTSLMVRYVALYAGGKSTSLSVISTINGALTGMVAVGAGVISFQPWAGAVTGFIGGLIYMAVSTAVVKMKVDDPLDAVAVHMGGGLWGLLAAPLLRYQSGIVYKWDRIAGMNLAWNLVGAISIIAWAGLLSIIMFGALRLLKTFRVHPRIEKKGLDIPKHDEPAYPYASDADSYDDEKAYDRDDDSYTETSVYSVPVGGRYDRGRPRPGGFEAPRPRAIMPQGNAVRNAFNARNATRAFNLGAKAYDMGQNMFGSGDF